MNFLIKRPFFGLAVALLLLAIGVFQGRDIPLRLSLMHLLPEDRPSVVDSVRVAKEVGGVGYLIVLVGPSPQAQQYHASIDAAVRNHPDVRFTFYKRELALLGSKLLYGLPEEDFTRFVDAASTVLIPKDGGLLSLGIGNTPATYSTEEAKKVLEDLAAKWAGTKLTSSTQKPSAPWKPELYFNSSDGQYSAFWIKPNFDSEDLGKTERFVQDIHQRLSQSLPKDVPFHLWGRYVNHMNDVKNIRSDIALTSMVSFLAIALLLYFGLGSLRLALVTVLCVTISMGWTVGFARMAIGQINIITGFLLAILGGLGVEYGVHLIRRMYQEKSQGASQEKAFSISYSVVGRALLSAALTSAGAFLILGWSDFRAFSELGWIAGFGILSIYACYMLCLPALRKLFPAAQRFDAIGRSIGAYPFSKVPKWVMALCFVVVGFGLTRAHFEYDFTKMRELSKRVQHLNVVMEDIMNNRTTTPMVLMANDSKQAAEVQQWLSRPERKEVIHSAWSFANLLPENASERYQRLQELRERMATLPDARIESETGLDAAFVRSWFEQKPYTTAELPNHLVESFGNHRSLVLVYTEASISRLPGIRAIVSTLQDAATQFPGLVVGGDIRIFNDILNHVFHDGLWVLVLFFVGAFFVLWLDFKSLSDSLQLVAQLALGVVFLVGFMGFFNVPFTIVNIGMLPAVLAAGVDIGVHVRHRELETGKLGISAARFVAQAVQLSVLTTLLGFGALFLSSAGMLRGIAWISVLGQLSMYLICMWIWPTLKEVFLGRQSFRRERHV